jgi:aminoglycoside 2'-N-acetyltransferase I
VTWPSFTVDRVRSADLGAGDLADIRSLLEEAFAGDFSADDWAHATGGWHVLASDGALISHAAVVERWLSVDERPARTGYVEAVATVPARQGRGAGSAVIRGVGRLLLEEFELGALSTGVPEFYERLGWERWRGPSFVRVGSSVIRTPSEDDGIMVLRYGANAALPLDLSICCESRQGDDW